jgi:hypothetical protein
VGNRPAAHAIHTWKPLGGLGQGQRGSDNFGNEAGSLTMNQFPTMRVDRSRSQSVEPLGSKPKFWFRDGARRLLFKAEDRGTGEDWAEVVACHLCALVGLPHIEYELAAEYDGQQYKRPGVVCENMARMPVVLMLGNQG